MHVLCALCNLKRLGRRRSLRAVVGTRLQPPVEEEELLLDVVVQQRVVRGDNHGRVEALPYPSEGVQDYLAALGARLSVAGLALSIILGTVTYHLISGERPVGMMRGVAAMEERGTAEEVLSD